MNDGRLGLIDFGCMLELDDALWELFRKMDRPLTTGEAEGRMAVLKDWSWIGDDEPDRLRKMEVYLDWLWQPRYFGGAFDFGDEANFRRGLELFAEMVKKRYTRGRPTSPIITRQQHGYYALLYRLKAKIEVAPIVEEEIRASGWDRSDYAPRGK